MLHIKKLDIFIIRQFALLFCGTFFICQFVLMMQFLWRYVDDLIGKGLTFDVMVQFFWYMGLMLVPQALPLAILLSSLITFGNLGESSELTAIKAAGISLMQAFRGLIIITILVCLTSFGLQNIVTPMANEAFGNLLIAMKHKSPELEIPEGVFYDGIPQSNIYVQKKDMKRGMLYGIMIYRMTGSYEDQAIILADSGSLRSTADHKHLLLTLHSGEWFENMRSQELGDISAVPYRRESFWTKQIVLDFDDNLNIGDDMSDNQRSKNFVRILRDIDTLKVKTDSMARNYMMQTYHADLYMPHLSEKDSLSMLKAVSAGKVNVDSIIARAPKDLRVAALRTACTRASIQNSEAEFRTYTMGDMERNIREHQCEAINKFTLSLSCLIFFFIGAPLGAIIRKGGLGVPVIISVLVFIVYYILDNTGYRMARTGYWNLWVGKLLSTVVLTPLAVFFTYKANKDSVVFNADVYRTFFRKLFGLRLKRLVNKKEVIIQDPDYAKDMERLLLISRQARRYSVRHHLRLMPNPYKVFFVYKPDNEIEQLVAELEEVIEDLGNTKYNELIPLLNDYPVVSIKAHTRPFDRKWLNIAAAIIVPLGAILYFRMWRFRLRLNHDLATIRETTSNIYNIIRYKNEDSNNT